MSKVVLITGGSSGLGKAMAEHLSQLGYRVFATGRNPKQEVSRSYELIPMDVTKLETIRTAVDHIMQQCGRLDVLINNAGVGITGPVEETSLDAVRNTFETNYFGALAVMQHVLPIMRKQSDGFIINITSIAGYMGLPFRAAYSASKSSLELTTEALRMELVGSGIKVVNVAPGDFATNIAAGRYHAPLMEGSPYATTYGRSLKTMNEHVDEGLDPVVMARQVGRILQQPHPDVHYRVGSRLQRFSVWLKGVLPGKWYERLLMKHYGLKK